MKRIIISIIILILCGILFYVLLLPNTPMLLAPIGGMVIGWVSAFVFLIGVHNHDDLYL